MIEKSEGKFKSFKIWPEFLIEDDADSVELDPINANRIYPKRDGTLKMNQGDIPILLFGVEIGKIE